MKSFSLRSLCLFAFVFCMMLATSTDAFAFGKRGKGLFGWRDSGSSSCSTCSTGSCSTGSCATSCENGQCFTANMPTESNKQIIGSDGTVYKQVCENGKCFLVAETGPATLSSKPLTLPLKPVVEKTVTLHKDGDAWKDASGAAWKVVK